MKKFDVIEHTADIGIVGYGADLKEAFANTAYGMFSLMADLEQVNDEIGHQVEVEAEDREGLVVSWLNELLYLFDVHGIICKRFDVVELTDNKLKAVVYGEKVDISRHGLRSGVKAATYHMLRVVEDKDGCSIRVIFDV